MFSIKTLGVTSHASALLVLFAFLIALFAATYQLSESPAVWYDEGFFMQAAINVTERGEQVMQLAPGDFLSSWSISAGYPLILPLAASFSFFDVGVLQARAVMVLYVMLFLAVAYLFARREFSSPLALASLLLLVTFPLLYGNGKVVLGEVPALFYLMLTLLSLRTLERRGYRTRDFFITGIFLGLTFAAKYIFMLVIPAFVFAFLVKRRNFTFGLKNIAFGAFGFLIPFLVWLYFQFGSGDSILEFLGFVVNPYDNTAASALPLILGNLARFVTEATPLYIFLIFITWVVALTLRIRKKEQVSLAEYFSFSFSLLVLVAYLWSPGWYRYFFPASAVILLFFPFSFTYTIDAVRRRFSAPLLSLAPYVVIGALIVFQGYSLVADSYVASYYRSARTAELTEYFSHLDPSASVFLYNVPEIAVFLPEENRNFYQYLTPHEDQLFGAAYLSLIEEGKPDIVVVHKEVYAEKNKFFSRYRARDTIAHYAILETQ